ncbi:MAG: linearmycin/streptolysin transport system permease protein [Acidobacteriota bacterium]|jgi:ABC-2 type transport system permease protein|nr:linearmycin/streptolysin transport system permease protein [Acidobacteriota bacterium]
MIFSIVRAGWMNLRRDRAAMMLSFIVPIVFFSIFATVFGSRGDSGTSKIKLAVADEDHSERSKELIDGLKSETALTIVEAPKDGAKFTAASAEEYVRAGNIAVALVVPKGFGESKISFYSGAKDKSPAFRLFADTSDPIAPRVVSGLLQKVVMTAAPELMMSSGIDAMDRFGGGLTDEQKATLNGNMASFHKQRAANPTVSSAGDGLVPIEVSDVLGKTKKNPLVAFYAAGIGVMFLLFTASNAGGALLEESESGTLDRILTTRVTLTTLLLGKLVYLWTLGLVQLVVMFVWGAIAFKLELLKHLGGFAIMALATSLTTAAFGLLLASVSRTRAQLGAISTLTVLTISAIGGSMFPRFLMPASFQKAGLVLFNSWAIDGFTNVFWREAPLSSLVTPVAVLIGCALLFFVSARQLTRRWELA